MATEPAIAISGPWTHRTVTANGTRFHVASIGRRAARPAAARVPRVLVDVAHQLVSLAAAGYRAVAVDLRGYGGSDKPPRGYDLITAAADAAGLIRALGEANAAVVGHDWGGLTAWTLAAYFPKAVRRLAVVSMAHPLRMRAALVLSARCGSPGRCRARRRPVRRSAAATRSPSSCRCSLNGFWCATAAPWSGRSCRPGRRPAGPTRRPPGSTSGPCASRRSRTPRLSTTRWFVRSTFRPDGLRYARQMRSPIAAPDPAPARRARPVRAAADRARRGPVRRGALPVEDHRRRGPLPARGTP